MEATIVGLAQELSLISGESANYIIIELPNGAQIRAEVAPEDAQAVTVLFVQSGSEAASFAAEQASTVAAREELAPPTTPRTPHPALARSPAQSQPQAEHKARGYAPMTLTDDGALEFGGDGGEDQAAMDDEEEDPDNFGPDGPLAAVGSMLGAAEAQVARAIGDTSELTPEELRVAAAKLRKGNSMPEPAFVQRAPTRRALRVEKDDMGNPIVRGAGLVDPQLLIGGADAEAGDVGQV